MRAASSRVSRVPLPQPSSTTRASAGSTREQPLQPVVPRIVGDRAPTSPPTCPPSRRSRRRRAACAGRSLDLHVEQARRGLGAVERLEVRVRDRDHVAAAVAVEPHRPDRLARPAGRRPPARRRGTRAPCRASRRASRGPVGSGPGSAVRKRIASGCWNRGMHELVGQLLAERHAGAAPRPGRRRRRWRTRSAICPPGIRAAHSTTTTRARRARRSAAGTRSRLEPERAHRVRRDALGLLELVAEDRRRVDVDPADAEADPRRPQPVGERQRRSPRRRARSRSRSSRSPRRTPRGSPRRVGDAASASCRCASMSSTDSTRKTPRWPPESAGLSTAGKPTSSAARRRSESVRTAAKRGCGTPASASRRRIATLCVIRCAVSTPIPGSPRASATAATTGTARSAETVSTPSSLSARGRLEHRLGVGEVDHLRDVGLLQARARPGCGRPRRRAARAPSPAGSRAAGGGRRRRRGRSFHGRRCYDRLVVI